VIGLRSERDTVGTLIEIERHAIRRLSNDGVSAVAQSLVRSCYESGGETFVAVMQAANSRDGDDSSDPGWHDRARIGAILIE